MRCASCVLLLALLPSVCLGLLSDICSAKPKDLQLEPLCVYRSPNQTERPQPPSSTNPRVFELSQANSRFALSLYRQLNASKPPSSNIFMSPISISTAFAMTKLGACDQTLEQIMKVFEFDTVQEKTSDMIHFFFAKLNCRLYKNKDKNTKLISANQLFGDKSLLFNETYQNISEMVYGAKMLPLNFKMNPEQARISINSWIANKTENQIQDTLPAGSLDSNAVLVLVNTIYFKGQWKSKFSPEGLQTAPFHLSDTESCPVTMMEQVAMFRYGRFPDDGVQVLELPYQGDYTSMVMILPEPGTSLSQVESTLDMDKLDKWFAQITETTVSVTIPRFRIKDHFSLKDKLKQMGLIDLFSPEKASLPGILQNDKAEIFISDAYHKASLEVNEEGSEASAATAVIASGRSLIFPQQFVAERPFMVVIRESSISTLIFMGRVSNPCSQ